MATRLKPEILDLLEDYTGKTIPAIRSKISRLKAKYPGITSNSAGHLLAQEYNKSLLQKLDDEDKISLRGFQPKTSIMSSTNSTNHLKGTKTGTNTGKKPIIKYDSADYFIKEHIKETTSAYYAKCYTCVFILTRKILENLLIRIIKKKFPKEPELILNLSSNRHLDFSVILDNLYQKRSQFSSDGKDVIERINQLVKPFKDDANAKAHSWFHIVKSPTEIENWQLDTIIELIKILEKEVGLC